PPFKAGRINQKMLHGGWMFLKVGRYLPVVVGLALSVIPMNAQRKGDVSLWLTTTDRASLFAQQVEAVHFEAQKKSIPIIEVDDRQTFQSIDGFGFALTGGSAQLLMRMDESKRAELLKELFSPEGKGVGVSYLRVRIGSP